MSNKNKISYTFYIIHSTYFENVRRTILESELEVIRYEEGVLELLYKIKKWTISIKSFVGRIKTQKNQALKWYLSIIYALFIY